MSNSIAASIINALPYDSCCSNLRSPGIVQPAGRCNRSSCIGDIAQKNSLQAVNRYSVNEVNEFKGTEIWGFFSPVFNNTAQLKKEVLHEELHQRLFPSVKASLEYLTNYVAFLLGSISEEEFGEIAEQTALEYDDVIADESIMQMRGVLEKYMGSLDDIDFAALINVDPDRVLRAKR